MVSPERHHPQETPSSTIDEVRKKIRHAQELLALLSQESEVREGSEALFRAVLNIAISCADLVPGAGEIASWGADVLKIIEEMRYRMRIREVAHTGGDTKKVKREGYNLTPDVHWLVAVATESLEALSFFMAPTHAIETLNQLWYDIPRILRALRKIYELLIQEQERHKKAAEAARRFNE